MNDRHPLRRHARGRLIDIEQKIDVSTFAVNDVGFDAQVAGVLGAGRRGRKTCQRRSRGERACHFYKTTSADLLHLFVLSCAGLIWRRSYVTGGVIAPLNFGTRNDSG